MDKRKIRDCIRLSGSIFVSVIYLPHLVCFAVGGGKKQLIVSDIEALWHQVGMKIPLYFKLLYLLHNESYFRNSFYYRMGPIFDLLFSWYRPGDKHFWIPFSTKVGKGFHYVHPYSTVLNAEQIGDNFGCLHCVTIGKKGNDRPIIGDNVVIGCHSVVLGGIRIGNNVIIGAGSVVVKDIPDNSIVAGNPAKIIKMKSL